MKIKIYGIAKNSIVDGPGLRYAIFTQGCLHHCKGCHNPDSWAMDGGVEYDTDDIVEDILKDPLISGITFSGGDPFYQVDACADIIDKVNARSPKLLEVATWTGFVFEDLLWDEKYRKLLNKIHVIVDGPYREDLRSLKLKWRGSSNQRVLNAVASVKCLEPIPIGDPRWL